MGYGYIRVEKNIDMSMLETSDYLTGVSLEGAVLALGVTRRMAFQLAVQQITERFFFMRLMICCFPMVYWMPQSVIIILAEKISIPMALSHPMIILIELISIKEI